MIMIHHWSWGIPKVRTYRKSHGKVMIFTTDLSLLQYLGIFRLKNRKGMSHHPPTSWHATKSTMKLKGFCGLVVSGIEKDVSKSAWTGKRLEFANWKITIFT